MNLTKRQQWLLDYLKTRNGEDPERWISLQEVVDAMNCDLSYCEGDNYQINDGPRSHNPCPSLWADKEAINADPGTDTPIIYDNYSVKIPSSLDELNEYYADDLERRAKRMLWRMGVVRNKAKKDGQMKIEIGPDGKPTERFIEAIIRKAAMEIAEENINE